ncbi:hypothetical protein LX32DRAFT_177883 [Colletotrichum zoysiae]|uniref:Uncharacterized protein n=1 Tax=Colletotrichum zoysiae TaxID=1216348 RepID=A0AAD9H5G5_9PEZI|nr:hypothetical protein LX32DRAFT_177883 [Colletotrichum zoysiae]
MSSCRDQGMARRTPHLSEPTRRYSVQARGFFFFSCLAWRVSPPSPRVAGSGEPPLVESVGEPHPLGLTVVAESAEGCRMCVNGGGKGTRTNMLAHVGDENSLPLNRLCEAACCRRPVQQTGGQANEPGNEPRLLLARIARMGGAAGREMHLACLGHGCIHASIPAVFRHATIRPIVPPAALSGSGAVMPGVWGSR